MPGKKHGAGSKRGPCKFCRRTHKKRCWRKYLDGKAARKAAREQAGRGNLQAA